MQVPVGRASNPTSPCLQQTRREVAPVLVPSMATVGMTKSPMMSGGVSVPSVETSGGQRNTVPPDCGVGLAAAQVSAPIHRNTSEERILNEVGE
jgi:hypothetical protein